METVIGRTPSVEIWKRGKCLFKMPVAYLAVLVSFDSPSLPLPYTVKVIGDNEVYIEEIKDSED